jgi:hypothetical protein
LRSAEVYLRKNAYFINPLVGSAGGEPCLFSPPVTMLPDSASPARIGEAVQAALAASHPNASWPTDWKALIAPLLSAAGAKDWASFAKGTRALRADELRGRVVFLPTTSKKERSAFTPIGQEFTVDADLSDAVKLGEAVQLALSRCD